MALEQKLSLRLAQRLVMTPSLQQAIKLLQMTRMELEGVLNQELVENPLLEESGETVEDAAPAAETAAEEPEKKDDALADIDLDAYFGDYAESWEGNSQGSVFEERQGPPLENTLTRSADLYDHLLFQVHMLDISPRLQEIAEFIIGNLDPDGFLVASIEELQHMGALEVVEEAVADFAEVEGLGEVPVAPAFIGTDGTVEADNVEASNVAESSRTPEPILTANVASAMPSAVEAPAHVLALDATEEGAVPSGLEGAAALEDAASLEGAASSEESSLDGYSRQEIEEALTLVRTLDPPGIACWNLQQSLLLQLDARGEPEESLTRRLVADMWDAFTHRKFEAIAKEIGIPLAELRPVVEVISGLETRPGRRFNNERTHYVEPDVHVVKVGDEYVIQLNDNGLPRLRVSGAYRKMLRAMRSQGSEAEAQAYIKEKMRSALWLIKSLDQRQRTIYKVATSIVQQQRAFLENGVDHLVPMVLRDVAEDIEMHESTVSRVVSNKYIHTPRGLLPMKFFFHSGIDREYGGDISSLTVKRKIKNYIQEEDSKKPLSDSELMRILNREGIHIARRTVAKYRDELSIPSSTERKQIF